MAASRLRSLAVDLTPLQTSRDYRLLWLGELAGETGRQITLLAILLQVAAITDSALAVGALGLVQLGPLVTVTLLFGPVIDRLDRRRILLWAQLAIGCTTTALMLLARMADPPLVGIYLLAAVEAGLVAIVMPTRSSITPGLVPAEQLPSALALNQVMWNTTLIAGPALAGLVIKHLGFDVAYGIDLLTIVVVTATLLAMAPAPPKRKLESGSGSRSSTDVDVDSAVMATGLTEPIPSLTGFAATREGLRFLRKNRALRATFWVDLVAMIFGMPRAIFPFLAVTQFERAPGDVAELVGWLMSAVAVGALLGALTSGWVGGVRRQGLAVLIAVAVWGAGITAFGLAGNSLWLAFGCLAVAGAADVISAVFRSAILQLSTPDELRGRLSSVHILVVAGGPRLGDFEAGVVASMFTPTISVVSGGVACIVGVGVMAAAVPELRNYLSTHQPSLE